MKMRNACGLLASLMLTTAVGCANVQNTVRGQSPQGDAHRVQPAGGFHGDTRGGVQQIGCSTGNCGQPGACQTCGDDRGQCGHKGCNSCGGRGCGYCAGGAWYPTHHHYVDYDPPRNLTYPAANVPPANVVYPYYTFKGPDDFFKAD